MAESPRATVARAGVVPRPTFRKERPDVRSAFAVGCVGALLCALTNEAAAADPVRIGAADAPIARSVSVPSGDRVIYVSGTTPDPVKPDAAVGSVARYGDTETQTRSVLEKIDRELAAQDMHLSDIVAMRVFLVAPSGQQRMDFAGMMRAYLGRFGTPEQPNKPARSTVQVVGLVDPGFLVEIEVTAAARGER